MKLIVTAGGQGTKLWPYSRENKPKQFQPIVGDTSSFQHVIEVLLQEFAPEDIFISTKRKFIKYVSEQAPQISLKNYIVEPDVAKDTGPAFGLALVHLSVLHPNEPFFYVQSDCIRKPDTAFLQMIKDAGALVESHDKLFTGGIKATEPNIGVDYLELGERVRDIAGQEVYHIANFLGRKKTYRETKELVEQFTVVTHSNHYCWYPDRMLDAYKQYNPEWYATLMEMKATIDKPGEDARIETLYQTMPKGSIEEQVTKHVMAAGQSAIILLPFKWTDIGTWGSVFEFFANENENYQDGKIVAIDTTGSLLKTSNPHKVIAVAGLQNMVVVDTEDALLVIPKDHIEKIKDIQAALAQDDPAYL